MTSFARIKDEVNVRLPQCIEHVLGPVKEYNPKQVPPCPHLVAEPRWRSGATHWARWSWRRCRSSVGTLSILPRGRNGSRRCRLLLNCVGHATDQ